MIMAISTQVFVFNKIRSSYYFAI